MNEQPLVSIIILTHNSERYLPDLLKSIEAQTWPHREIIIMDNASTDQTRNLAKRLAPSATLLFNDEHPKYWFSRPNNLAMLQSRGDAVLICNHDIVLDPAFLAEAMEALKTDPRLGSVAGKVYKMESLKKNDEYGILDTTGLVGERSRRFRDRGEGEEDRGQYDRPQEVFGGSGALTLYRRSSLDEVAYHREDGNIEFFDEDFNAYKEDVDLAWRLQAAGWHCLYLPTARAWHDRRVGQGKGHGLFHAAANRSKKNAFVRRLSAKNQWLLLYKHEHLASFLPDLLWIGSYEMSKFFYLLIAEPSTLSMLPLFFRQCKAMNNKRQAMKLARRRSPAAIVKQWFRSS